MIRREAQLLIDYADSPIVATATGARRPRAGRPRADPRRGDRPLRLYTLLAGRGTPCCCTPTGDAGADDVARSSGPQRRPSATAHGHMDVYLIAAPNADVATTALPLIRDSGGDFARMYSATGPSAYVIRPDGYVGFAADIDVDALVDHLRATFR